jgi:hypothetical protein
MQAATKARWRWKDTGDSRLDQRQFAREKPPSSPSPRSCGERVGVSGSLDGLDSRRVPLTRNSRCANFDLSPQERGEVK